MAQGAACARDGARVCNSVHALLELLRESQRRSAAADERLHRARDDCAMAQQAQARLGSDAERLARELAALQEQHRQLALRLRRAEDDAKAAGDALKKARADAAFVKTHAAHENKRRDRDVAALRERLAKLVQDKSSERKMGLVLASQLQRPSGERGKWASAAKAEDDLSRLLLLQADARTRDLAAENSELRAALAALHRDLAAALNSDPPPPLRLAAGGGGENSGSAGAHHSTTLADGHFELPAALALPAACADGAAALKTLASQREALAATLRRFAVR